MSDFSKVLVMPSFCLAKRTFQNSLQPKSWVAALAGISLMEAFFHFSPHVGLPRIDFATTNGTFFLPPGRKARVLGQFVFYLGAVGWVSLFSTLNPKMKGTPKIKTIKFGTMVYLFASVVVMPGSGFINPYMRKGVLKKPGLFGLGLNGWKTAASNFIAHMIFSQVLLLKQRTNIDKILP